MCPHVFWEDAAFPPTRADIAAFARFTFLFHAAGQPEITYSPQQVRFIAASPSAKNPCSVFFCLSPSQFFHESGLIFPAFVARMSIPTWPPFTSGRPIGHPSVCSP